MPVNVFFRCYASFSFIVCLFHVCPATPQVTHCLGWTDMEQTYKKRERRITPKRRIRAKIAVNESFGIHSIPKSSSLFWAVCGFMDDSLRRSLGSRPKRRLRWNIPTRCLCHSALHQVGRPSSGPTRVNGQDREPVQGHVHTSCCWLCGRS